MIKELDIYRTAKIYADQYGEDALFIAMTRAETYREEGNENGMAIWSKIADAIEWIQMPTDWALKSCH